MSDLAGGRYPDSEEEWLLDGQPSPPYRRTISRRDIVASANFIPTVTTLNVYAVPVQAGDIFSFVSFLVKTAGATLPASTSCEQFLERLEGRDDQHNVSLEPDVNRLADKPIPDGGAFRGIGSAADDAGTLGPVLRQS